MSTIARGAFGAAVVCALAGAVATGVFAVSSPLTLAPVAGVVALAVTLLVLAQGTERQRFAVPVAIATGPLICWILEHQDEFVVDAAALRNVVIVIAGAVAVAVPGRRTLSVFTLMLVFGLLLSLVPADDAEVTTVVVPSFLHLVAIAALWLGAGAPAALATTTTEQTFVSGSTPGALPSGWNSVAAGAPAPPAPPSMPTPLPWSPSPAPAPSSSSPLPASAMQPLHYDVSEVRLTIGGVPLRSIVMVLALAVGTVLGIGKCIDLSRSSVLDSANSIRR